MGFLVSPGVEVNEIDMTNIIPALSTSIGAYAGEFNWGPIGRIVTVSSEADLASIYGAPTTNDGLARSFFTAASFLKYGNTLRVSRAGANGILASFSAGVENPTGKAPYSSLEAFEGAYTEATAGAYARYGGSLGNGLTVVVITENSDGDSYYGASGSSTANAVDLKYRSQLTYSPSTTEWAYSLNERDLYDECAVLIVDSQGKFSNTIGTVLEKFEGLSLAKNAKTTDGANNYFIDVVNSKSNYVFLSKVDTLFLTDDVELDINSTANSIAYAASPKFVYTLGGGANGSVNAGNIKTALELFEDTSASDINFIFAESISDTVDNTEIDIKLIDIAQSRKDVIAYVSAPMSIATTGLSDSSADKTTDVITYFKFTLNKNSNYAMFGSSPVQMYNKYTDRFIWVPDSGHIAGLCAFTDDVAEPWFSPAGLNRGQLRGVSKLALNPNQTQRDDLYKAHVNPIVSFPGEGIVLYGDKTATARPSAFDRINVRRLFITLEKAIATFAKYQLFELNDEFTRAAFRAAVEPYLRTVQARRGITDFRVICDTTNNTGAVIDANGFVADIYIKPARSINFITLNFIATRTGVEFKEIVGG
jgi:hypothetical protein